ncbi:MAG: hypothetical protein C4332_05795 [Meiothermus sp.]
MFCWSERKNTTYLLERITINPRQRGSRFCVRRIRVCVTEGLDPYAARLGSEQILGALADLEPGEHKAVHAHASTHPNHPRVAA